MKALRIVFATLIGIIGARGYELTMPQDAQDGIYGLYFDDHDTHLSSPKIQRMHGIQPQPANLDIFSRSEERPPDAVGPELIIDWDKVPPHPLPVSSYGCTNCTAPLDPLAHWISKQVLYRRCDLGMKVYRFFGEVAVQGDVIVWVCSCLWFFKRNPCPLTELYTAETIFNQTCGEDKGAWVHMKKWRKSYGRSIRGHPIDCPCVK
ncbi:hypothetical protein B0T10DRAFT_557103 [Thelonectria olida]|uniref:Uncharacterized protein n=1 Tax=Thelonectria olida TaxID=1576542 RepID=A0A9P9AVL6_9HYPO|nr:hypothetical protein B0T10DRAFT_557103 [Thelonectria olida]